MIIGVIQWIIISLILILLIHHLFFFFKNTLTVPKIKDLIHQPATLYTEIEQTLNSSSNNSVKLSSNDNNIDTKEMKSELKNFFNELSENKQNNFVQNAEFSKNIYAEL